MEKKVKEEERVGEEVVEESGVIGSLWWGRLTMTSYTLGYMVVEGI